jgi:sporulation protein YlmC with PRC-barrel domain
MRSKLLLGGLLASVIVLPVLAQSNPPAATPAPSSSAASTSTTTAPSSDMWRASKVIGVNVYNDQDEKLGDISEILLDKSGKVDGVVIGVGGFLGMGQRDIKVEWSKLKFVDEPVRTSAASNSSTTGAASNANRATVNSSATTSGSSGKRWYPDHAVLSGVTKDQLKNMPEFKY